MVLGKCVGGVAVRGAGGGGGLLVSCWGEVGCSGGVGDAKALGQSPWGQLWRGGVLGFPCCVQGELWCPFSAAEVSLPAAVSFPPLMPWCWLWSVFLSLVARLCFHVSCSFLFVLGKVVK